MCVNRVPSLERAYRKRLGRDPGYLSHVRLFFRSKHNYSMNMIQLPVAASFRVEPWSGSLSVRGRMNFSPWILTRKVRRYCPGYQVFPTGGREGGTPYLHRRNEMTDTPPQLRRISSVDMKDDLSRTASFAGPVLVPGSDTGQCPSAPWQREAPQVSGTNGRATRGVASASNSTPEAMNPSPSGSWERRRGGSRADGVGSVLCRMHDLTEHLRQHVRAASFSRHIFSTECAT